MFYNEIKINGTGYPLAVNITGSGVPTAATEAEVGMLYMDTDTGELYKCTAPGTWVKVVDVNSTANALKGAERGTVVAMGDVSPLEHKIPVKLSSASLPDDTNVMLKIYGKNLIPYPYPVTSQTINGVTFTINEDGTITVNGKATANAKFNLIGWKPALLSMKKGIYYTLSGCPKGGGYGTYRLVYSSDPGGQDMNDLGDSITRMCTENADAYEFYIYVGSGTTVNNLVFKPQFEVGTKTPFKTHEVIDTITTTIANGAELLSRAEGMTITTDNAGVVIDCVYNKDTNKVIEKLTQAIISLGGNI